MYIAKGQRQITLRRQNFDLAKCFTTLFTHCKFKPLIFTTPSENDFSTNPHTNAWGRKFELAIKRSTVNLRSLFEQICRP